MRIVTVYFIVLLLEIFGSITYNKPVVFLTKPLLMPILMLFAYQNGIRNKWLYLGLLFSLFGDVFLMFSGTNFFILGLSSFLIAHLFYITLFKPQFKFNFLPWVGFGVFVAAFLVFIIPVLPSELVIPLVLYSFIIATMGVFAASRTGVSSPSYQMILIGAILFIISDALIAVNAFHTMIPKNALYIMSTYGLAQLLIVRGWIKQTNSL